MRAEALVVAALVAGVGCHPVALMTRPEGDGGWTAARRRDELGARAIRAGVALDPSAADAGPRAPDTLTLPDALALAAQGNRRIAMAGRSVAAAEERVWDARGRLLPAVGGSGRYTRYTDAQTTNVALSPGLLPAGVAPPVVIVRENENAVLNGTATVPIDLWGELRHTLTAAQAGYRGERARQWATTLGEQAAVVRAYYALLEAKRLRTVTDQTLAFQRAQLGNASQKFDHGRLTNNELLVVQVAVRNAEQAEVQRALAVDAARWELNEAVGRPVDAPTDAADVAERPALPPVDEALRAAWTTNPALVALVEEQQRLEDVASSLARGRLPRFEGGGAIDWQSSGILQPEPIGQGFVGFRWDLGTDGRREAQIAEARIQAERNRLAIEDELRGLETAIRRAHRAAEERLAALAASEAAVGQAEENLRIRTQQFDVGRATSEDVLDAEALLTSQRATLATALYQAHTRRAELQQLMGLPLDALVER